MSMQKILLTVALLGSLAGMASCRYDMQDQPKVLAYRGNENFSDSISGRQMIDNTVARGFLRDDAAFYTGKNAGATATPVSTTATTADAATGANATAGSPGDVAEFPYPVTAAMIDRGENRYNVYCTPCHGRTGSGDGMIARRGFRPPPSYHTDRLRNAPVGHFFDVISNGFGAMPDYSQQLPPSDRWAVVAYIRALQLSMNAKVTDLAPSEQDSLNAPPKKMSVEHAEKEEGH